MEYSLENKNKVKLIIKMLKKDIEKCECLISIKSIEAQLKTYEDHLKVYDRKPVYIKGPYEDDTVICKFDFVSFTDEELQKKNFVKNYITQMEEFATSLKKRRVKQWE